MDMKHKANANEVKNKKEPHAKYVEKHTNGILKKCQLLFRFRHIQIKKTHDIYGYSINIYDDQNLNEIGEVI